MKYRVTAAYQRRGPLGDIINETRTMDGEGQLPSASEEVQKAYFASVSRVKIINDITAMHDYIDKSIANIQVTFI